MSFRSTHDWDYENPFSGSQMLGANPLVAQQILDTPGLHSVICTWDAASLLVPFGLPSFLIVAPLPEHVTDSPFSKDE